MVKYNLVLAGLVFAASSIAAPVLTVDNPTQNVAPGRNAIFFGSVAFDTSMPMGAEPALSPALPPGLVLAPAVLLIGPFGAGETYTGPLFAISAQLDAAPQVYAGSLTVGGTSNPVAVSLTVTGVPEPGTFGLAFAVIALGGLGRRVYHFAAGGRLRTATSLNQTISPGS